MAINTKHYKQNIGKNMKIKHNQEIMVKDKKYLRRIPKYSIKVTNKHVTVLCPSQYKLCYDRNYINI